MYDVTLFELWRNRAFQFPPDPPLHHSGEQDFVRGWQLHDRVQSVQRRPSLHLLEEVSQHEQHQGGRQLQDRQGAMKSAGKFDKKRGRFNCRLSWFTAETHKIHCIQTTKYARNAAVVVIWCIKRKFYIFWNHRCGKVLNNK